MEEFPDPSGPPYPYQYPLPAQAKAEHQRAVQYFRRKYEFWDRLLMSSISVSVPVIAALFTDEDGYLPGSALLTWVAVNGVLAAVMGYRKSLLSDERDKHWNLLQAYGVLPHEIDESAPAVLHPDFDTARDRFGMPLPGKEEPSPQPIPKPPAAATVYDEIPGGNPYSGVIRLGPPKPRPEIGQ